MADLEHQQWVFWASSLLPILEELVINHKALCDCSLCARVRRWQVLTTLNYDELTEEQKDQDREWADKTLMLADRLGVVIKVDRELPEYVDCISTNDEFIRCLAKETQEDMLKAGYVAVEPLIE